MPPDRWSPFPGLRLALACVTAILTAQAFGLSYPQWAGLVALSTLAGTDGAVRLPSLLPKTVGVLSGAVLTLIGVGLFGQERWLLLAWLSALAGVCAAAGAWTALKPFSLAVGTTCFPATIFAVTDWPHALTAAWSRAEESLLGFFVVAAFDVLFWSLFRHLYAAGTPAIVVAGKFSPSWRQAWRAGLGAALAVAAALTLWYEAEVPSATALVLDAGILALGFAAAPSISLLGALTGCAAGSLLAAVLMLLVWPALPQGPETFALPLLPALWVLLQAGRSGAFGGAVASFGSANLLVGLNLSAVFSPQADAILNRCLGLFIGGLLSAFILRAVQTIWPLPNPEARPPVFGLSRFTPLSEGAFAST